MNDQDLVRQVLNGNRGAFQMLIDQHQTLVSHMVGRVIKRDEDHEEVCQDIFLRVYDRLNEFKFESKLSTWIATIAFRMSINFIKKKELQYVDQEGAEERLEQTLIDSDFPADLVLKKDSKAFLNKIIMLLPVQYRTVLTLYHLEEMTYPEIKEITGMPEGTVKNYLFRARKLLKERLEVFLKSEEL